MICYLCGRTIKKDDNLDVFIEKNNEKIFHHTNCYLIYNRLRSVYGNNISGLGFNKIKLNSYADNLIDLLLFEFKKTSFKDSEIFSNTTEFKDLLSKSIQNTKEEVLLLFSSKGMCDEFCTLLESFSTFEDKSLHAMPTLYILIPKDVEQNGFLSKVNFENNPFIKINNLDSESNNFVLVIIDKKTVFFSILNQSAEISTEKIKTDPFINIVSKKDTLVWYGNVIYDGLWKQVSLENKIENLSHVVDNTDVVNNNVIRFIAHELKTPIQPILGFSEMIRSNSRLNSDQKNEILNIISRNARKLDLLTNNILDYARMENDIFQLNIEPVDIVSIIQELKDDYQLQSEIKGISVDFVFPFKPVFIHVDKVRITEVLDNVIGNSIKFTETGTITINLRLLKYSVIIEIVDSGCGIKQNNMPKIFDKFFTTDKSGTGLGLYLSKIIVERHKGNIAVKNNPGFGGCTFSIELPIQQ